MMCTFFRYLSADFKKTKHHSIRFVHLLIPICVSAVFIAYYSYSSWNPIVKLEAYFQVLGIGFPFLIGLFCVLLTEQESTAGNFQGILMVQKRQIAFFSKLLLLLSFGIVAILLACGLFGGGYSFLLNQSPINYSSYWIAALVLLGSNVFLYIWHMYLSLRFNKGVSIGLGIVESLLSALFLTGLGNGIWMYIPCTWGSRLVNLLICRQYTALSTSDIEEYHIAILFCIIITLASLLISVIWFCCWDGQRSND